MLGTEAITVCRVNAAKSKLLDIRVAGLITSYYYVYRRKFPTVRTWLQQLPVFRMYVWRILCCRAKSFRAKKEIAL